MIDGYRIYDADAHVNVAPQMWAAVVFGTARDKMLSDEMFNDFWDEFARYKLPLCVHMAASFPAFDSCVETFLDAHALSMALPAQMAFVALLGRGMMDRYADLRIAFMEFGAEWLFICPGASITTFHSRCIFMG